MKPSFMKSIRLSPDDLMDVMLFCAEGKHEIFDKAIATDAYTVEAHGLTAQVTLVRKRLDLCRDEIRYLLNQLPVAFHAHHGDSGCSFAHMNTNSDGGEWGTTQHSDMLLMLGIASGMCSIVTPLEMWSTLPGGVPNILIETRIAV